MIQAILFDVDGVLIDSIFANWKFFCDLFSLTGYKSPTFSQYKRWYHLPMYDVIKIHTRSESEKEIQKIWLLGKKRGPLYGSLSKTPKDMTQCIKLLSNKYLLGIVTSRQDFTNGIKNISKLNDLKKLFNVIVSYEDTQNHKPHPEPLLYAVKKLKLKPHETAYIGDAQSDVISAKKAGVKIISYPNKLRKCDEYTNTFSDLPKIIKLL